MSKIYEEQLMTCYDQQADTFAKTRERFWPEIDFCLAALPTSEEGKPLKIVDLGCGAWRLSQYIHDFFGKKKYSYLGVDSAKNMIATAQKTYPDSAFLHDNMLSYLSKQPQQSLDVIICLASFHHLMTREQRILMLQYAYKTLSYGWRLIMVNRSYSQRFFKRYRQRIVAGIIPRCTRADRTRNDILIPRKGTGNKTHLRYYHMFTHEELFTLAQYSWFVVADACYITTQGDRADTRQHARNTFFVLEKSVVSMGNEDENSDDAPIID